MPLDGATVTQPAFEVALHETPGARVIETEPLPPSRSFDPLVGLSVAV